MIWSTWSGGERADLHGPVEGHVERAGRAVEDQVVGAGARRHRVPTTCGPGTISGSVFWLKGGLRMLAAAEERDRRRRLGHGGRVDVARRQARERRRHRVLVGRAVGVLVHRVAGLRARMSAAPT